MPLCRFDEDSKLGFAKKLRGVFKPTLTLLVVVEASQRIFGLAHNYTSESP